MNNEKGYILVLSLMLLLALTLLSLSAVSTSIFEAKLAGNNYHSIQAFYSAESGWNEVLARIASGETIDSAPTDPNWRLFIASDISKANSIGYTSADQFLQSFQNMVDYAVKVEHRVADGEVITYAGKPTYRVTSHGFFNSSHRIVEVLLAMRPSMELYSAVYSKSMVNVKGSSTVIQGMDQCGTKDTAGILTKSSISTDGNPIINGVPPKVENSPVDINIEEIISYAKGFANFNYGPFLDNVTTNGDWGSLEIINGLLNPIGDTNVVYFDMNKVNTLKLSAGSHGSGILLVDGNLELQGGFSWYGVIVATGTIKYTGGGENMITGGVLSGSNSDIDTTIGGNASINFCSKTLELIKKKVRPAKVLSWKECF